MGLQCWLDVVHLLIMVVCDVLSAGLLNGCLDGGSALIS
jgi:hypothetical protein